MLGKRADCMAAELITEKELVKALKINRRTAYYWRLQGMPFVLSDSGVYRYRYDLEAVKRWAKEHRKKALLDNP